MSKKYFFDTRRAISVGVVKRYATVIHGSIVWYEEEGGGEGHRHLGKDAFWNYSDAVRNAEARRDRRIEGLKRQLESMEALKWSSL